MKNAILRIVKASGFTSSAWGGYRKVMYNFPLSHVVFAVYPVFNMNPGVDITDLATLQSCVAFAIPAQGTAAHIFAPVPQIDVNSVDISSFRRNPGSYVVEANVVNIDTSNVEFYLLIYELTN